MQPQERTYNGPARHPSQAQDRVHDSGPGRGSQDHQAGQKHRAANGTYSGSCPRPSNLNVNARSQSLVWKRPDLKTAPSPQPHPQPHVRSEPVSHPTQLNSQPQAPLLQPQQQRTHPPRLPVLVQRLNPRHLKAAASNQVPRPFPSKSNTWVLGRTLVPDQQLSQAIPTTRQPHAAAPQLTQSTAAARPAHTLFVNTTALKGKSVPSSSKHKSLTWRSQPGAVPPKPHTSTQSCALDALRTCIPPPNSTNTTYTHMQPPLTSATSTSVGNGRTPAATCPSAQPPAGYVKCSANKLQLVHARKRSLPGSQHIAPSMSHAHKDSRATAKPGAPRPNVWKRVELSVAPRTFKLRRQQDAVLTKLRRRLSSPARAAQVPTQRSNVWKHTTVSLLPTSHTLQPPAAAQQPRATRPISRSTWTRENPTATDSKATLVLNQLSSLRARTLPRHRHNISPVKAKSAHRLTANKLVRVDGELQRLSPQPAKRMPRRTFVLNNNPQVPFPASPLSKPSSSRVHARAKDPSMRGPARKAVVLFANAWRRKSGLLPSPTAVGGLPGLSGAASTGAARQRKLRMAHERSLANARRHFSISSRKRPFCALFCRSGICAEHQDGRCRNVHDVSKVAVCVRWLQGRCDSPECKLQHALQPDLMPICGFFLKGLCIKEQCPYLHINYGPDTPVCREFLLGHCSAGQNCSKQHLTVRMAKEVKQKKRARTAEAEKERLEKLARCDDSSLEHLVTTPVFDLGSLDLML